MIRVPVLLVFDESGLFQSGGDEAEYTIQGRLGAELLLVGATELDTLRFE